MGTTRTYVLGLLLSLLLTSAAFFAAWTVISNIEVFPNREIPIGIVVALAILQLFVQLKFFLHLGSERSGRWNFLLFAFALLVVVILVAGTLWIMNNVQHGQMTMPVEQIIEKENMPNMQMSDMQSNTHE